MRGWQSRIGRHLELVPMIRVGTPGRDALRRTSASHGNEEKRRGASRPCIPTQSVGTRLKNEQASRWQVHIGDETMKYTTVAIAVSLVAGCNTNRIDIVKSAKSPDGKWVIAAEFDRSKSQGAIVIRDAVGNELARDNRDLGACPCNHRALDKRVKFSSNACRRAWVVGRGGVGQGGWR